MPNNMAIIDTGSPILFVVVSVDVQQKCLYVDGKGYSDGGATWTLDFSLSTAKQNSLTGPGTSSTNI
jgi:hypothetical protein